jgi:hypothetical protein
MFSAVLALLVVSGPAADVPKTPPPAKVAITAAIACLHCDYGEGDGCAACLKIDDATPVKLAGKVAANLQEERFSKKVVTIEGTLVVKDGRLLLTADRSRPFDEQNPGDAPAKGTARIAGTACCGSCDLKLCEECTLAVVNGTAPVVLDGKLAAQHAELAEARALVAEGRPFVDKRGVVRLAATKTTFGEKK